MKASGLSRGLTVLAVLLWPLGVSAIPVAPYLPLVDGNAWTYQVNGGASANQTSTVQSGTVNVNGVPTKRIYSSSTGETDNYTNDANGVRFHGAFLPSVNFGSPCLLQAETQTFSPPFVFAPADIPSFPNSTGTQSGSVSIALSPLSGSPTCVVTGVTYSGSATMNAPELVTVPMGSFMAVRGVRTTTVSQNATVLSTQNRTYWVVSGVGTVKEVMTDSGQPQQTLAMLSTNVVRTAPDAFTLGAVPGAALGTLYTSNPVTITGTTAAASISISGGEYSVNGGTWTAANGTVTNGQSVRVRVTASAAPVVTVSTVLNVGGVTDTYSVTTAPDTQAPTVPTSLSAVTVNAQRIDLTWAASTDNVGVTGYRVYRNGVQVGAPATASYSDTGVAPATTYIYTVAACDAVPNCSAQSASVQAATPAVTAMTLGVSPGAVVTYGSTVTLTGTITGGSSPSGNITFKDGGATLGSGAVAGIVAVISTNTLVVGSHSLTASYSGDANNLASSSGAVVVTVNKVSPGITLTANPSPAVFGKVVTLSATITGGVGPTGSVTFKDGAATLGSSVVNAGIATLATSGLPIGSRSITAIYTGDTNHNAVTSSTLVLAVNVTSAGGAVRADLDGDGKSDIVWRNTSTGENYVYLMNGLTVTTGGYLPTVPINWTVMGTGDFDGDGKADILWRNGSTGDNYLYQMNGLSVVGGGYLPNVPIGWTVAGVADFNGDGKADVLWRNSTTGENYLYIMNGTTVTSQGYLPNVPINWTVAGVSDLDGDGKADIVWRNTTTGDNYGYLMNGLTVTSQGYLPNVPTTWSVAGVGDFNGDGKADIVWRNGATGDNYIYLMNGLTLTTGGYLPNVPIAWTIAGTGDHDGDGKADILWRNTATGDDYLFIMNGLTIASQGYLPNVPAPWTVTRQ